MKFLLVDKILALEPGKRIVTVKALSLAEEYLQDHFPAFPVLPGVLMLEAMTQAAAWLVLIEQDYRHSIVQLQAARNVRYASFAKPGDLLRCEVDVVKLDEPVPKFKAATYVGERQIVSARLELTSQSLADRAAYLAGSDEQIRQELRETFKLVGGPPALAATAG